MCKFESSQTTNEFSLAESFWGICLQSRNKQADSSQAYRVARARFVVLKVKVIPSKNVTLLCWVDFLWRTIIASVTHRFKSHCTRWMIRNKHCCAVCGRFSCTDLEWYNAQLGTKVKIKTYVAFPWISAFNAFHIYLCCCETLNSQNDPALHENKTVIPLCGSSTSGVCCWASNANQPCTFSTLPGRQALQKQCGLRCLNRKTNWTWKRRQVLPIFCRWAKYWLHNSILTRLLHTWR